MKFLFASLFVTFALGIVANAECIDRRAALITPCPDGQTREFVQGSCTQSYEFESMYCSDRNEPACMDLRRVRFSSCPRGQTRIHVKGHCKEDYQAEHSYCTQRDD